MEKCTGFFKIVLRALPCALIAFCMTDSMAEGNKSSPQELATEALGMVDSIVQHFKTLPPAQQNYMTANARASEALSAFLGIRRDKYLVYSEWVNMPTASALAMNTLIDLNRVRGEFLKTGSIEIVVDRELVDGMLEGTYRFLPDSHAIELARQTDTELWINEVVWTVLEGLMVNVVKAKAADLSVLSVKDRSAYLKARDELEFKYFSFIEFVAQIPGAAREYKEYSGQDFENLFLKDLKISVGSIARIQDCSDLMRGGPVPPKAALQ